MLVKADGFLTKILPIMTPISLVMGILIGESLEQFTFLISWVFAFMTFSGSLGLNFKQFNHVIYHPIPILTSILILHIITPLWNWGVTQSFFHGDTWTIVGFTLIGVIPTAITSFLWTSIYKGNIPLVLSIILIDTFLSPIIVPLTLKLLIGESLTIELGDLIMNLIFMIVLPSVLAMAMNSLTKGEIKEKWGPKLSPFSKIGVFMIVFINGGIISSYLSSFTSKVALILVVAFIIVVSGYLLGWVICKGLKMNKEETVAIMFSSGMRNNSLGSVLAVSYFPSAVILPVVLVMLFQQVVASIIGGIFFGESKKNSNELKEKYTA